VTQRNPVVQDPKGTWLGLTSFRVIFAPARDRNVITACGCYLKEHTRAANARPTLNPYLKAIRRAYCAGCRGALTVRAPTHTVRPDNISDYEPQPEPRNTTHLQN
jgi:hypothetical protein